MRDGLITLIFVDWLPPFTYTSRGFLSLGSEVAHLRERSTTCSRIPRPTAAAPRCLSKLMVQYSIIGSFSGESSTCSRRLDACDGPNESNQFARDGDHYLVVLKLACSQLAESAA